MKKNTLIAIILAIVFTCFLFLLNKGRCALNLWTSPAFKINNTAPATAMNTALALLKTRRDKEAGAIFEDILTKDEDNLKALWGKAEVLRRNRQYREAENILKQILSLKPDYDLALISLSHIRYKEGKLEEALSLISQVLNAEEIEKENEALAYVLLGAINNKRVERGGFITKIAYGTRIKGYFLKAKELAPDSADVRLALGSFYLLAPKIIGGNLERALVELESVLKIAPDFATANARLAQAYKKKRDLEKYNFYLQRTKELDPYNDVLKEIKSP